jgi:hypothetical protein
MRYFSFYQVPSCHFTLKVWYNSLKIEKGEYKLGAMYLQNTYLMYWVGMGLWEFDTCQFYMCIFGVIPNESLKNTLVFTPTLVRTLPILCLVIYRYVKPKALSFIGIRTCEKRWLFKQLQEHTHNEEGQKLWIVKALRYADIWFSRSFRLHQPWYSWLILYNYNNIHN